MASLFEKDIQFLKGVGEKRARLFRKLGVDTVGALLRYYPRSYEDWSRPVPIAEAPYGQPCCIKAAVAGPVSESRIRKGMTLYKFRVCDGLSVMQVTLFNNKYAPQILKEGEEFLFFGKVAGTFTRREMSAPLFEPASRGARIRPVYGQTEGLSSRLIETAVKNAFLLLPEHTGDSIPDWVRAEYALCPLRDALKEVHFPTDMSRLGEARKRLMLEELLILQLGLMSLKGRNRAENSMRLHITPVQDFYSFLPFTPTGAQKRAIQECLMDMANGKSPMNRLIQGDVGSGKTAVAAALCYCVVQNQMQAAFMAPTEILAEQHYRSFSSLLQGTGIQAALLTGSTKAAKRREILAGLENGEISLVIGTHALLSDGVAFCRLGLVITDEQHRFGVAQRAALASKGRNPHLLVMSATPIPRTLALMIYGDLDVSLLNELPPGRQPVDTFWVDSSKRQRAFRFLQRHIDEGRQAYVVCPLVEENDSDMASAQEYARRLREEDFAGYTIGLLHGKMKAAEKEQVMADFAEGRLQILVSTTVIEVGVDVPNAAIMLIENAERFGLSQLHQLRGRVGRGSHKSYCILISDAQNEEAKRRLSVMCRTNDGFRIADEDLKLRGPGDFFGSRQHGLPDLKIANLLTDVKFVARVQDTARKLLEIDPKLDLPEHRALRAEIRRLFAHVGEGGFN